MKLPDLGNLDTTPIAAALATPSAVKALIDRQARAEEVATRFLATVGPQRLDHLMPEVHRRETLFREYYETLPYATGDPGTTALESVLDDVINGRL
jgi:hypothetical protein